MTLVDIGPFLKAGAGNLTTKAATPNLIAVRVHDWALSGGLWVPPCMLALDRDAVTSGLQAACFVDYAAREALVRITQVASEGNRLKGTYAVTLRHPEIAAPTAEVSVPVDPEGSWTFAKVPLPSTAESVDYDVTVQALDSEGKALKGVCAEAAAHWPAAPVWGKGYGDAKVLNNFVAELFSGTCPREGEGAITFVNPREGWVFVAVSRADSWTAQRPQLFLDGETRPQGLRVYPETGALEAMRFLTAGRHSVRMSKAGGRTLVIRSVPELAYCFYPTYGLVKEHGPFGLRYLERFVFPHVNVLVRELDGEPDEVALQWVRDGRRWIVREALPGLGEGLRGAPPIPAEEVYDHWATRVGSNDPRSSGIIIDEFSHVAADQFDAWTEGLDRWSTDARFADKTFYAWTGELYRHRPGDRFREVIREHDHRFVWENYLSERPTDDTTRCYLIQKFVDHMNEWRAVDPEVGKRLLMCPGIFSAVPGTLSKNPGTNFNVFLDWQYRVMATDPAHADLWGVVPWGTHCVDDETLQWAYRLTRHYCIEGNTTLLSTDPYELKHLENPDFAKGLAGWTVKAAEEGSVAEDRLEGFSWVQGRYWRTNEGDAFLRMTRSAKGPNRVSQTVKGLEPGRLYSVKLVSTDLRNWEKEAAIGVRLDLEHVSLVENRSFRTVVRSRGAGQVEACKGLSAVYLNYIRLVFRAKGTTALLTISDASPAGAENQVLACNFVELQPWYFAE